MTVHDVSKERVFFKTLPKNIPTIQQINMWNREHQTPCDCDPISTKRCLAWSAMTHVEMRFEDRLYILSAASRHYRTETSAAVRLRMERDKTTRETLARYACKPISVQEYVKGVTLGYGWKMTKPPEKLRYNAPASQSPFESLRRGVVRDNHIYIYIYTHMYIYIYI